jgi:hypothetical protein
MRMLAFLSAMLLLPATVGSAQEKDAPPGPPPQLWLASASEQNGEVVLQLAKPEERLGTSGQGGFEPGVKTLPAETVMKWGNLQKVTLGKTVQAFRVKGERAEPSTVLTRPDPFYLALLCEDTLVLVVNHKDLYSDKP